MELVSPASDDPLRAAQAADEIALIKSRLPRLSAWGRTVVELYLSGQSPLEISVITGRSRTAVRTQLSRSLGTLTEGLEP